MHLCVISGFRRLVNRIFALWDITKTTWGPSPIVDHCERGNDSLGFTNRWRLEISYLADVLT